MNKLFVVALFCLYFVFTGFAQIDNPVTWSFSAKKIGNKKYELHMTAMVQDKWHLYAQQAGEGPEPTSFSFTKNPLLKFEGKVIEVGKLETAFDPNFNSTLRFYTKKVDFVQKVTIKSTASTVAKGELTFMVCNDRKCLPPKEIPFSIPLTGK